MPDFLVHHRYPEYTDAANPTGSDSDSFLLQSSTAWSSDAAVLRQEIADYFGPGGTNIELICTENNSDSGAQGRQSTSLVNGLYYADSLAQLMTTEFNSFVWWDLRNGTDAKGSFDADLYGWRTYGDLGLINGLSTRHPTFYAAKLMRAFIHPAGTVLRANTDFSLLSAYAAREPNGSVSVLVIHKDPTTNFNAQIAISGFDPAPVATVRFYGMPQDEAARTNAASTFQDLATNQITGVGTNFNLSFPPLSMTLLTLSPAAPEPPLLGLVSPASPGRAWTLRLQGKPGQSYLLQSTTDLVGWATVSTNTLSGTQLDMTLPSGPSIQFWRAAWTPAP